MNRTSYNTADSPYKIIARDKTATQKLLKDIDALLYSRIEELTKVCGSPPRVSYLVESLVPYGRYVEVRKIVSILIKNRNSYSTDDVSKGLVCLTNTVDLLLGEMDNLLSDVNTLELIVEAFGVAKPSPEQSARYRAIAERRAYVRASAAKLKAALTKENIKVSEREILGKKMNMFAALDTYPNLPTNEKQAKEIESVLDILEPALERLQLILRQYQRKHSNSSLYTDILPQSNNSDGALTVRFIDRKPQPNVSKTRKFSDITPSNAVKSDKAGKKTTERTARDTSNVGLGTYRIQRGDNLADIISGQTAAGHFPIFYELTSEQRKRIITLTRKYLSTNPVLLTYIGSPDTIDRVAYSDQEVNISLDALHDIVVYIAHEQNFIRISESQVKKFREMLKNDTGTEKREKNYTTNLVSIKNTVVQSLYDGNEKAFAEEGLLWLYDMVSVPTDDKHFETIIQLTYEQWEYLRSDSGRRYEWLRRQDMPLSVYNAWSDVMRYLYSRIPKEQKQNMKTLTINEILQLVFAYEIYLST